MRQLASLVARKQAPNSAAKPPGVRPGMAVWCFRCAIVEVAEEWSITAITGHRTKSGVGL